VEVCEAITENTVSTVSVAASSMEKDTFCTVFVSDVLTFIFHCKRLLFYGEK